ncbi:MAG: hypothetical protein HZB55_08255 [Deltaproteobacteria bacterium]|nr:hypothetical protein [Deltaproteobacteria bacterium]
MSDFAGTQRGEGGARGGGDGTLRSWLVVVGLGLAILLWGFFLFIGIGDKGPAPWDFGAFDDLPGSSPYATHGPQQFPTLGPPVGSQEPVVQHVGGEKAP